jgi:hypothetical protein
MVEWPVVRVVREGMVTDLLEKDFTDNVVQLAKTLGWRVAHFRPAQTKHGWRTPMQGDKGFPDLVLAKDGRVIFAELKSATGKLTKEQREWLDEFSGLPTSPETYVWRPHHLDSIGKVLSGTLLEDGRVEGLWREWDDA